MIKTFYRQILLLTIFSISFLNSYSQSFTTDEYKKALWMTTRMYGGQRSGDNNWLVYDHLPAGVDASLKGKCFINDKDGTIDLSGGWHDCADHVKFGQTEFYAAYVLLKSFSEIPTGYSDYYSYDYKGYKANNKWNWEDKAHDPNGIPDILDEVKHATDYFIKVTPNASTFYYQMGDGDPDHMQWVTAVKMQTNTADKGGQPRVAHKNPKDASMPGFCGATLALMSRLYKKYDPAYSDLCLMHAKYAYAYAKANPGTVSDANGGNFYGANTHWEDEYVDLCAELYLATNEVAYKTEALTFVNNPNKDPNIYYTFDYANNGELAWYNLVLLGETSFASKFISHINTDFIAKINGDGIYTGGSDYGTLRYNANAGLMAALSKKLGNTNPNLDKFVYANIDYILGKNSQNQSFVVGFGNKYPLHAHHRNLYLNDGNVDNTAKNKLVIPAKNTQFGYMVGGVRSGSYPDDLNTVKTAEGGIDYNAGLVGALAYINSLLAPVQIDGQEDENIISSLKVYPNPSSGYFSVSASEDIQLKIYDNAGNHIAQIQHANGSHFGSELNSGLYHLVFSKNDKVLKTINVIKL